MFKSIVCVKAVPDPKGADRIRIDPVTKTLTRRENWPMNWGLPWKLFFWEIN